MSQEAPTTTQTQTRIGKTFYMMLSKAGPNRDLSKPSRQQAFWDEHAVFIDALVDDGFITLGGPFEDEGGAALVVRAADEAEVRERTKADPWYQNGLLELVSVKRWTVFIDQPD